MPHSRNAQHRGRLDPGAVTLDHICSPLNETGGRRER
jgi:hypothetical protein